MPDKFYEIFQKVATPLFGGGFAALCASVGRFAANSTHASRREFSATRMSRQKTDFNSFAFPNAKLCEAFFDRLKFYVLYL